MICKHCGYIVPDGAVMCPQCGAEVNAAHRGSPGAAGMRQGRRESAPSERSYSSMPLEDDIPVSDAALKNGFGHYNHFTLACNKLYGASPTAIKKQRRQRDVASNAPLERTA